jgi:hypothetical protein
VHVAVSAWLRVFLAVHFVFKKKKKKKEKKRKEKEKEKKEKCVLWQFILQR